MSTADDGEAADSVSMNATDGAGTGGDAGDGAGGQGHDGWATQAAQQAQAGLKGTAASDLSLNSTADAKESESSIALNVSAAQPQVRCLPCCLPACREH